MAAAKEAAEKAEKSCTELTALANTSNPTDVTDAKEAAAFIGKAIAGVAKFMKNARLADVDAIPGAVRVLLVAPLLTTRPTSAPTSPCGIVGRRVLVLGPCLIANATRAAWFANRTRVFVLSRRPQSPPHSAKQSSSTQASPRAQKMKTFASPWFRQPWLLLSFLTRYVLCCTKHVACQSCARVCVRARVPVHHPIRMRHAVIPFIFCNIS